MNSPKRNRVTVTTFLEMKQRGEKIAMLTAYDYLTAEALDEVGIDAILVGDTLGMVFAGYETTLPVTLEQMLYHCQIVSRAAKHAMVIGDMPFMTYQVSPEQALQSAGRLVKEGGVGAIKLEGGRAICPTIRLIVRSGIPVMGHIGLTPQSVHKFGGYKLQGADEDSAKRILESAHALQSAGCFAIVLEKIPAELARRVSESLRIPTIGIGAGPYCDGQVLVTPDMLGLFDRFRPRFVKRYAELATITRKAFQQYIDEVKQAKFPTEQHSYNASAARSRP